MPQIIYFVEMDGEVYGPFELETIRGIHLTPDILVLSTSANDNINPTDASNSWRPASEYSELEDSLCHDNIPNPYFNNPQPTPNPPSFDQQSVFYIKRGDVPYGPYTLAELAKAAIQERTILSLDNMNSWYQAGQIPGLLSCLISIASLEPVASPSISENEEKNQDAQTQIKNLIKSIYTITEKRGVPYKLVFNSNEEEVKYTLDEYNRKVEDVKRIILEIDNLCQRNNIDRSDLRMTSTAIEMAVNLMSAHLESKLSKFAEDTHKKSCSIIITGNSSYHFSTPFDNITLRHFNYVDVLSSKPIFITFDEEGREIADKFTDTLLAKLYQQHPPRGLKTTVIDLEELSGLGNAFKMLDNQIYSIVSDPNKARDFLRDTQAHIGNIIRNLLVEPGMTLRQYNIAHETQEPYQLLILKNFPSNLYGEALNALRIIAKNGTKAGVHLLLMMNLSELNRWDSSIRANEDFNLSEFIANSTRFDFCGNIDSRLDNIFSQAFSTDSYSVDNTHYQFMTSGELASIVDTLNSQCALKEDAVIPLTDHITPNNFRWKHNTSRQIEIPFGLTPDKSVASLKITQESGQNSVIVIGIPGSGKSVFLHSIILSSAFKYSPEELQMYLIDFSGVEFNTYALGHLPHARVIAPEAEREFGLSILRELEEEGSRRMELCRDNNVNNIVELKRLRPELKIPRLLVIIDEFQKLFDENNDKISQEANAKIHTIIQEFRKFGINLILATQKLPANSLLPRDLIANRVVFKCTPNDFQTLISWENAREMPRLHTGACIYNSESGASYDNRKVQGFFASKQDIDIMLHELDKLRESLSIPQQSATVFRSAELPEFSTRRRKPEHHTTATIPTVVPIYLGESIAVSQTDVAVELIKENNNNLLIIGGESTIAERIAFNSIRSATSAHDSQSATVVALNGMRADNPLWPEFKDIISNSPVNFTIPCNASEIVEILTEIKTEIETRRNENNPRQPHIYIVGFDIQNIRAFDPDSGGIMVKPSAAAKLMAYILANGPAVGVFSILQTDTLVGINRIDSKALDYCNYRIALQMPESTSMKVMDSYQANKLFVFNRPASKYRAYMRDNLRNLSIKFKPYK